MKNIVITGANGFIGQHLVEYLSTEPYEIRALIRPHTLPSFTLNKNVSVFYGDITNKNSLIPLISHNSIVINLAANPYHPTLSYEVNVKGLKKLIDVCINKKVSHFIQISSQATKIKNKGVYAKTKELGDQMLQQSGLPYTIIKPSLVYGGGEKGLLNKIRSLLSISPFVPVFGSGKTKLNAIYIDDFNYLLNRVIQDGKTNTIYEIGTRETITYNKLYETLITYLGKKSKIIHIPVFLGIILGKIFSKLPFAPFYVDNVLGSTQETHCSPKQILDKYSFTPRSLDAGFSEIVGKNKLKVGIVGLGKMGMLHGSILSTFKNVEIVALIDSNKNIYSTIKSMGIKGDYFDDINTALKNCKLNALYVLTPTFTHSNILKKALKHNINVFIEKPVSIDIKDLNALHKIKTNCIVHSGYTLLFHRTYHEVKKYIDSDKFGAIKGFTADFKHSEVLSLKKGWMFTKKLSGGGVMMNPGPHLFSLLNYFFDVPVNISGTVKKIYSEEVEDVGNFKAYYKNYMGTISLSWSEKNHNISDHTITINFEKAQLTVNKTSITITKNKKMNTITFDDITPLLSPVFNINPATAGEAYYIEDALFINAIQRKKTKAINDLDFALNTEKYIFNCYKASE